MGNTFFNWNSDFDTGIKNIDKQHRQLVDYIDKLYSAVMADSGKSDEEVKKIVLQLHEYSITHLDDEEKLFKEIALPDRLLAEHLEQHDNFRQKQKEFADSVRKGYPVTFQVVQFLKQWLSEHIMETDMKYVEYMKQEDLL